MLCILLSIKTMKTNRLNYFYRKSASKLHKAVGDCLRSSSLKGFKIYQEYPVNKINRNYSSGREKFDWVILDLKLIIECHGEQHYRPVTFGGITGSEATANFEAQKRRDQEKQHAAHEQGFSYIIVPYTDEKLVTEDYIIDLINRIDPRINKRIINIKPAQTAWARDYARNKDAAKLARQEQYQKKKAWAKKMKDGG